MAAGTGVTCTHGMRSLVHNGHLSTSGVTGTHGWRSLVHTKNFYATPLGLMGGTWGHPDGGWGGATGTPLGVDGGELRMGG